ncbi:SID1 transmembrane family member 1-like isoform X2 [Daktulosphaira vitifoliae]|uniref:SID1 transmembrane family member 1-like isoform X2 n=1 Tax=Daktulosphaira vitifoliae TaxID=58002 RepID=UPI0021A97877|nr:SID1 transmembrane family member 1-like isoform X2 [Daktulosphaira vitifoliae]
MQYILLYNLRCVRMYKLLYYLSLFLVPSTWCATQFVNNYNSYLSDLTPIVYNGNYSTPYSYVINETLSYLFLFNYTEDFVIKPPRVMVTLLEENYEPIDPLIVVVRYRSGVLSWQLPYTERSQTIRLNQEVSFDITPSEPIYYYYNFLQNSSIVLLHVTSEDNKCMTLSIQNYTCPVYDSLETVGYDGLRQTVSKSGGIIVSKDEYPYGLFIVFVVHSDDSACSQGDSNAYDPQLDRFRVKHVSFIIKTTVNFNNQILACLIVICVFILIFIFTTWFYNGKRYLKSLNPVLEEPTTSSNVASVIVQPDCISYDSSVDETDVDILKSPESWKDLIRTKSCLYVSDLAKKDYRILQAKSRLYLWNLITVAVFYSLPVIQLVFTYQKVLNQNGNQDLCYYNFLCSHSLILGPWKFSDFNHIFSNIGYVFFGLLFILITFKREYSCVPNKNQGIPNHCGLYYAMGSALAMEGIMSACYHVCPNHSNFQFDTSFMYVICMLSMIKIYQTRHPDINANAYMVFGVLAIVIILGLAGIMYEGPIQFILFTCLHLILCFWLSAQIYYMGRWKLDKKTPKRIFNHLLTAPNPFKPKYPNRMVLLSIGNLINLGLAISHWFFRFGNFGNYLLTLFMVNLILYLSFYIVMKLISNEKLLFWPMLFILLAMICWSASMYFYMHKSSSWTLSAAESRTFNTPCTFMDFYDNHDVWHFLSAASLFLSFMVLLTLDDDVSLKPRSSIPVF